MFFWLVVRYSEGYNTKFFCPLVGHLVKYQGATDFQKGRFSPSTWLMQNAISSVQQRSQKFLALPQKLMCSSPRNCKYSYIHSLDLGNTSHNIKKEMCGYDFTLKSHPVDGITQWPCKARKADVHVCIVGANDPERRIVLFAPQTLLR